MKNNENLSSAESLAWTVAYDSNNAFDTLQAARAKEAKYEEIGSIGLEGVTVTIDEDVAETVAKEVETAQHDFNVLSGMANAVAIRGDSPFAVSKREKGTLGSKPAPEKRRPSVQERADKVLVYLLKRDGRVEEENGVSAGAKISESIGMTKDEWASARNKLKEQDLIELEKKAPTARSFTAVSVNEQTLLDLVEQDGISPAVRSAAAEHLQQRRQVADGEPGPGGAPDFLADKGGEEPVAEVAPVVRETETDALPEESLEEDDDYDDLATEETGLEAELDSIRVRHQPKKRRGTSVNNGLDRTFAIGFEVEGRSVRRDIKIRELMKLPPTVRMLVAIGQVNTSKFDFYTTEEQRRDFVLRIINKGIEDDDHQTDEAGLDQLIGQAIAEGYLHQNGNGPELTGEGIDFVRGAKYGRTKLGQAMPVRKSQQGTSRQKAGTQASGASLSKATVVA